MSTTDTTGPADAPSLSSPDRPDPVLGLVERDGTPKDFGKGDDGQPASPPRQALDDALGFFAEEEDQPLGVREVIVNVGTDDDPREIKLVLRALENREQNRIFTQVNKDRDLRRIKDDSARNLARQDAVMAKTIAAALVSPNPDELARATGNPDTAEVLRRKFGHKPGLFVSLMSVVQDLSGNSEDDVRTAEDAGNGAPA